MILLPMCSVRQNLHIGFLFYDFSDSRAMEVLRGIEGGLDDERLSLFPAGPLNSAAETAGNDRLRTLDFLKAHTLDGLITLQFWESEGWYGEILGDLSFPVVPLLRSYKKAPGITVPYEKGCYDVVRHLIEIHGCRKPYYLVGSAGKSPNLTKRLEGFKKALEDAGIPFSDGMIIEQKGSFSTGGLVSGAVHQGVEAVDTLFGERKLRPGKDVDSLVVFNDRMALEVIGAMAKRGLRVPEDLKVVSHDDIPEAETATVPLTTSGIDWRRIGFEGLDFLREKIRLSSTGSERVILPDLIVRKSCGCPNPVDTLFLQGFEGRANKDKVSVYTRISDDFHANEDRLRIAVETERRSSVLRNASVLLAKCGDTESFVYSFCLVLAHLGIDQCSLCICDSREAGKYRRIVRWKNGRRLSSTDEELLTLGEMKSLLAVSRFRICESLDQGSMHIGFLFLGTRDGYCAYFGELREILSSVLYSIALVENLKATQEQLVQDEKFSSLGRLTAGIAHEVNTPLGIGITASSHLTSLAINLKKAARESVLSEEFFYESIDRIVEASGIIQTNLERAGDLVRSFKQVSVDNISDTQRRFPLKAHMQDLLLSLKPLLKQKNPIVEIRCPEELEPLTNPGVLSQVLSNLIINSLRHGFPDDRSGRIIISASMAPQRELFLIYEDDGVGMDAETLEKVFEPFYTTGRDKGGSGLGMFIVYNMVSRKLKGTIKISSVPNEGMRLEIQFPYNGPGSEPGDGI